jgi:hypothetical protein
MNLNILHHSVPSNLEKREDSSTQLSAGQIYISEFEYLFGLLFSKNRNEFRLESTAGYSWALNTELHALGVSSPPKRINIDHRA